MIFVIYDTICPFAKNKYFIFLSKIRAKLVVEELKLFCVSWPPLKVSLYEFTFFASRVSAKTNINILRYVSNYVGQKDFTDL